MSKRFVVGSIEFLRDGDRLSFWPARTAKIIQVVGAVGIAIISGAVAVDVAKNQPLSGLLGEGNAWNTAAVIALAIFAFGLLISVPVYLIGASNALVLDSRSRCLLVCGNPTIDLNSVSTIVVRALPKNAEVQGRWHVAAIDGQSNHPIPLLDFDLEHDAHRVAAEISGLFGLSATV